MGFPSEGCKSHLTNIPQPSMRTRVSIVKEDRIWHLRCQGYDYDSIGSIVNVNPHYMTHVLRRVRQRPPIEVDPIKRGRRSNFLSDSQVEDIRMRRARGETALSISKDYAIGESAICKIANNVTYKEPAYDSGYKYSFANRLTR
jgi:hypothetical protein